jgi:hypothetical protein
MLISMPDSWEWADVSQPSLDLTMIQEEVLSLQLGQNLGCNLEMVVFEGINLGLNAGDERKPKNLFKRQSLHRILKKSLCDLLDFPAS